MSWSLSQDSTALLFFDDFNRADNQTVGSPTVDPGSEGAWVEEERPTNIQIVSNKLDMHEGAGTGVKYMHRPDTEATTGRLFTQWIWQWASATQPAVVNHHAGAFASRSGYQLRVNNPNIGIDRTDSGTNFLDRALTALSTSITTDYYGEFLTDDGLQRGGVWRLSNDVGATVSLAEVNHDGLNRRTCVQQAGTTAESLWDAIFSATKETIDVSGLASGQKIQLQLVSDDSVVIGATESGGSVSLDISRFTGTVGTPYPALEGIALKLVLLDSGDTVLATLVGSDLVEGNIWPGTFSVSS